MVIKLPVQGNLLTIYEGSEWKSLVLFLFEKLFRKIYYIIDFPEMLCIANLYYNKKLTQGHRKDKVH